MIIQDYPNYSIDINGVVTNVNTGIIKKHQYWVGYKVVSLYNNGKVKNFLLHRLIACHFIPNPENKPCINHINGVRDDNRIENLEWCTNQENLQHAYDIGLHVPHRKKCNLGEKGGMCKITEDVARYIINATDKQRDIAKRFGISQTQVSRIKNKIRWGHLI